MNEKHRKRQHKYESKQRISKFYTAIRKYGLKKFKYEIIDTALNYKELIQKEIFWIKHYNSFYNGYNLTTGGEHCFEVSEETREKLRIINTGKKHSKETKEKLRILSTGRKQTKETKIKISLSQIGKKLSKKHKNSIKKRQEGSNNSNAKPIICITDGKKFGSITEAANHYNITSGMISRVCRKKRKTTHKMIFKYWK